jgi:hypothetical protein
MKRTEALIAAVGEVKSTEARIAAVLLALPMLVVTIVVDLFDSLRAGALEARELGRTHTTCPRSHVVALEGVWTCACGFTAETHAWARCAQCGARSARISCPCSLSIQCPLPLDEDEQ